MPRHRHRAEPVRRPLPRLPRPQLPLPQLARPVVAVGVGATLLGGVAVGVITYWPDAGSGPATRTVIAADDGQRDAALALRTSLLTEERTSRDQPRSPAPAPASPAAKPPVAAGQLWATTDVTIRSGPSTAGDPIGVLKAATRVGVTGVTAPGWTQVMTNGRAGWVKSAYLSSSKPKPKPAPTIPGVSAAPCHISPDIEPHLTTHARMVYRAVCAAYGSSVSSFGGYRAGDSGDHGSGRAVDIMVSGQPGTTIARYVQAHARELGVAYVIYQQRIWEAGNPIDQWKAMEDRGSPTANHYDHVHVSVT